MYIGDFVLICVGFFGGGVDHTIIMEARTLFTSGHQTISLARDDPLKRHFKSLISYISKHIHIF